ncbi:ribonuclease III domain-containing protein [Sporobolomyces salmoneus]|uniref:ribonuclease III domain-containing protein n=1 Tax=Sporobolomyces salmoneus TaxID=183962 RepID=UPI00316FFE4E
MPAGSHSRKFGRGAITNYCPHNTVKEGHSYIWNDPLLSFDKDKLPPLLEIPTPSLARQAVRHPSYRLEIDLGGSDSDGSGSGDSSWSQQHEEVWNRYAHECQSYEVLETIGDAILYSSITQILCCKFPAMTSGPLSDIRKRLLSNDTLSHLSLAYGLPQRLLHNIGDQTASGQKLAADLFEAHVGGLSKDATMNPTHVHEWLEQVYSFEVWPTLERTATEMEQRKMELELTRLARKPAPSIGEDRGSQWTCPRCDVRVTSVPHHFDAIYDTFDPKKGWHCSIYQDGLFRSCGHAVGKREATFVAAFNNVKTLDDERDTRH